MKKNEKNFDLLEIIVIVGIIFVVSLSVIGFFITFEISGVVKEIKYETRHVLSGKMFVSRKYSIVFFEDGRTKDFKGDTMSKKLVLNKFNVITYNGFHNIYKVEVREKK